MANPWRQLTADVQTSLQSRLVDAVFYSWFGGTKRDAIPPKIPGARSFGSWFDEYYRNTKRPAIDEKSVFAEWRFNHALTEPERNSLLCVHAKVRAEQLLDLIATIRWIGDTGQILFVPTQPPDAVRNLLKARGYGDWWMASHNCRWGMRSRFRGVQLHFRGPNDDTTLVNVHIDLHNPGDPTTPGAKPSSAIEELGQAIQHSSLDDSKRTTTHTPLQLRAGLATAGIEVPSVP